MAELNELKSKVNLLDYIKSNAPGKVEKVGANQYRLNPCPICNGKDHFTIYADSNSYSSFSECCKGGSIIDYLIEAENYTMEEAIKRLYAITGTDYNTNKGGNKPMNNSNVNNSNANNKAQAEQKEAEKKAFVREQKKQFILNAIQNQTSENKQKVYEYLKARGISQEIADKYHLFISNDVYEDSTVGIKGTPRLVIPVYKNNEPISYVARALTQVEGKIKALNSAGEQTPLNIDYIKQKPTEDKCIFICEGWADALSIEDVGRKAIALHSTSNTGKLIDQIKDNYQTASKYVYMLCYDNDEAGFKANMKLAQELQEMQIMYRRISIPKEYKDINEWYSKTENKQQFKESLNPYNTETTFNYINDSFLNDISRMKDYKGRLTGFTNLDNEINGVCPGLYVLGAISSLGKTTYICQLADQMASRGEHIIFFSLEQSRFELVAKSISRQTFMINPKEAKTSLAIMQNTDIADITIEAVKNYQEIANNTIIVEGNFDMTVESIKNYVASYIKITGIKPIVILDYLQILRPINDKMTDKQQVDFNVTQLKRISRDYDIPIFVICSFNRENYTSVVDFTSFKESGAIEYSADVVMGLQLKVMEELKGNAKMTEVREKINEAKSETPRKVQLIGLKNRNGKSYFKCEYNFYPAFNYFEEDKSNLFFGDTGRKTRRYNNSEMELPF